MGGAGEDRPEGPGGQVGHRAVDLGRLVGVSAQQIRVYEASGVLPAAERTASGHRRFGERHRVALLAYRALARGCGPSGAREIVRCAHTGDGPGALALLDAAHAALHAERAGAEEVGRTLTVLGAEQAAHPVPDGSPGGRAAGAPLSVGEVARVLGVRASALRTWEAAGLLVPGRDRAGHRRFTSSDVREARAVLLLRRAGHRPDRIRPVLTELRAAGGATDRLRDAVAARRAALDARSRALLEGAAHLHGLLRPGLTTGSGS
ncbi:MerR family transcriptional regulator (plasmid) [Streptomyces sp. BI20]|uniref:MerR family transcriptional regulator n=1 Tax=Streptomyces sp. BI20 TaxID=3403460 RepID=UPI003C753E01